MTKEMIEIPDGEGGMAKVEANKFSDGATANVDKQQAVLAAEATKAREERIGACAEAHNRYVKGYASDHNMDLEEVAAAMHLDMLNWREFWPKDAGGIEGYDAICDETYTWFEENKNK